MNSRIAVPLSLTLSLLATGLARGATNGFLVPPFRGGSNSQSGYWEVFTVPAGAPGNLADRPGSTTQAVLTQHDPNAILTGSGNVYNPAGLSAFSLVDATPFAVGTVVLQTRTLGSELDYASVTLSYSNLTGLHAAPPARRVELDRTPVPGLGVAVSALWQWDLSDRLASSYEIRFAAAEPSASFDSLTLDTADQFRPLFTAPITVVDPAPAVERWMYPHNAAPCDRPASSTFATFGDEAGVDTRHSQHLVGWDTARLVPAGLGSTNYLVKRGRVTLTLNRGGLFQYDPTHDVYQTYLETNTVDAVPDPDAGRPIELFGVGYRNGFDRATFGQCTGFGPSASGQRNAFALSWSTDGRLVDVSNNVGKTNAAFPPFEAIPFAVAETTAVAPGELVPAGARLTFELNLADPRVLAYVQDELNAGSLRFMVSSLHPNGGQSGPASYPDFATRFNSAVSEPTQLELELQTIGPGDLDRDQLPDDWEVWAWDSLRFGGAEDPDADGASNRAEWLAGTHPALGTEVLRLSVARAGERPPRLRWPCAANRAYQLEFTHDWQTWETVSQSEFRFPAPGILEWVEPASTNTPAGEQFYRVRLQP